MEASDIIIIAAPVDLLISDLIREQFKKTVPDAEALAGIVCVHFQLQSGASFAEICRRR
jgi:hypothetical protein